jgi:hypothetical protein
MIGRTAPHRAADAGVAEQHVQASEALGPGFDGTADRLLVGHISD